MRHRRFVFILLVSCGVSTIRAGARDAPNFETLVGHYQSNITSIRESAQSGQFILKERYKKHLDFLAAQFQQAGDLSNVIATRNAQRKFNASRMIEVHPEPGELADMQRGYLEQLGELQLAEIESSLKLEKQFREYLATMVKAATQQGEIALAQRMNTEKENASKRIEDLTTRQQEILQVEQHPEPAPKPVGGELPRPGVEPRPTPMPEGPSLITNGDFEGGRRPWEVVSYNSRAKVRSRITDEPDLPSGKSNRVLLLEMDDTYSVGYMQELKGLPHNPRTLVVKFRARVEKPVANARKVLRLAVRRSGSNSYSYYSSILAIPVGTEWQEMTTQLTYREGFDTVEIGVEPGDGQILIDDVEVKAE